jgi:hypothetical protein
VACSWQADALADNLLEHGNYVALHIRTGSNNLRLNGHAKVQAIPYEDGYATKIPQYWIDAFRVRWLISIDD